MTSESTIGTLRQVCRYPVKSMRGEELEQVFVSYTGLLGDRIYAFVDPLAQQKDPAFPWHTARRQPELILYKPRFVSSPDPHAPYPETKHFRIRVTAPEGRQFDLEDPDLLHELRRKSGRSFVLRHSEKGMHDARPLSLFGSATIRALESETRRSLDPRRFRANFYVDWEDPEPFFEDRLVGKVLRVGERLEIMIVKKDPRCVIITLDPDDASPDPAILRTVARQHSGCAGVYAAVLREGSVRPGDKVVTLEP